MSGDKSNILVVDDLPEKILVLQSVLDELGQNIVTARSGEEALRRVLEHDFAVILLDVHMPGLDGLETAALIRRRRKSAHTPIIFLTAFADEMHTARGYSLGAVDYIFAPVVPEVLRSKVKVFVELYRMRQEVQRQADERVALAREQAARQAAEEATRRSTFLASAGAVLAGSLDFEATLHDLLRLSVPRLADLAGVTLVGEPGQPRRTELAWSFPPDPAAYLRRQDEEGPEELQAALERVLVSGIPETLEDLAVPYPPTPGIGRACDAGLGAASSGLLRTAMVLPLLARNKALGALTLAQAASGRTFSAADQALAVELAGRAASAIDNARLYRDVQEADRRKNDFLAMLAHELRNPLAPIRNAVQVMRLRGLDEPDLRDLRDLIDRQVQHLARLVDDLLDVSRITRDKIQLQAEAVDLAEVVARALETSRPLLDAHNQELTVTLSPEPLLVHGDRVRLAQVLGNLLNNAAKFTAHGGRVWLKVTREDDDAVLHVRDNGVGIPADMLFAVFDLFTQVDRSLDRSQGGLGIGLTLVKRLVELHGGRVQAFSPGPNQGSEFVVRLPALALAPARLATVNGASAAKGGPGRPAARRVLVVDDNADAACSLALLLRLSGHEVKVCHDGPAALEAAASYRPEVVLLDIGLPGMDGYAVARRLRALPGPGPALLAALTGYGQEDDIRRSREAGFDQHLVKPVDPELLTNLLAALA
jgi:signal transduction histidine kinase